jgi:hypothetical protein
MTQAHRAQQIWQVLSSAAHNRQILTYSGLGELIGTGAGTLAPLLGLVMRYCDVRGLPPLTVIVVNKNTGLPGSGLTTLENLGVDRERVFVHEWLKMPVPSLIDFEGARRSKNARSKKSSPAMETNNA